MSARVLLVGSGGREHAVAWKLSQSPEVGEIFVAPGNAGTARLARNLDIRPTDIDGLVRAAKDLRVDFYLATMDDPQPLGLVDRLQAEGVLCYGPVADAARIEASKAWAKAFMERHGIPTARGRSFSSFDEAAAWVESLPEQRLWVKASGLAAGKGAVGAANREEAIAILRSMLIDRAFGEAGSTVVVEEELSGFETSAHAFCDGKTGVLWPFATDYKRALDGAQGLNTGGMGAYAPTRGIDERLAGIIHERVIAPVLRGMAAEGHPFVGTLFPGLMVRDGDVRVIEYNARSGDPETQVVLPRLRGDFGELCYRAATKQALPPVEVKECACVGVVISAPGYPGTYEQGIPLPPLDLGEGLLVFHAGTRYENGRLVSSGGRVLTIVCCDSRRDVAVSRLYSVLEKTFGPPWHFRRDIGL
ncbi:MAG: phosphoribosylamine--glycine ligase [Fimbriimonadales bacterium]|nr:phosphoribosylamine--glycine ligase [Fimbriimonadales bacterium]